VPPDSTYANFFEIRFFLISCQFTFDDIAHRPPKKECAKRFDLSLNPCALARTKPAKMRKLAGKGAHTKFSLPSHPLTIAASHAAIHRSLLSIARCYPSLAVIHRSLLSVSCKVVSIKHLHFPFIPQRRRVSASRPAYSLPSV